jgi:tetratricopeptide (TPR) repeat protein
LADFARAVELDPEHGPAWSKKGLAHARLEQWSLAVASYSEAIALNPDDGQAWSQRGQAHAQLGRRGQAVADYEYATALNPRDVNGRYHHALLRLALERTSAYREACLNLLNYFGSTKDAGTANTAVWACVLAPGAVTDPSRLVQLATKAVEGDPRNHTYLNTLGCALYRAGQYREAIRYLNEAMKAHGQAGVAQDWLFLAMAHQRLGEGEEAKNWLSKAVAWIEQAGKERAKKAGESSALSWSQRLELGILRAEAEALVKGTKP